MKSFSRIRPRGAPIRQAIRPPLGPDTVVRRISACIAAMQAAGFVETAEILAIARLDLLARIHGVSDSELEALIAMADTAAQTPAPVAKPVRAKRAKPKRGKLKTQKALAKPRLRRKRLGGQKRSG